VEIERRVEGTISTHDLDMSCWWVGGTCLHCATLHRLPMAPGIDKETEFSTIQFIYSGYCFRCRRCQSVVEIIAETLPIPFF